MECGPIRNRAPSGGYGKWPGDEGFIRQQARRQIISSKQLLRSMVLFSRSIVAAALTISWVSFPQIALAFWRGNDLPTFTAIPPVVPSGVIGSPSMAFTVALGSGTFNGSQTITISDGGQGGTITPSVGSSGASSVTVTPTNGSSSFTFIYSAATTGNLIIGFSNGQGWLNPQPIIYYANTVANWFGAWNSPSGAPTCTGCTHSSYHSNIMNQDIGFNVYLPPQYATQPTTHFPVVYFFHGSPGDENGGPPIIAPLVQNKINASTVKPMIFVFPKVGAHEMDSIPGAPAYGSYMAESTIIYELMPYIDANYRTIANKSGRALQGFSMGGQGCERIGFKFPQIFSSLFCMAPAIDDTGRNIGTNEPALLMNMFNGNTTAFHAATVWGVSTSNASNIIAQALPIHVLVGDQDGLHTAGYETNLFNQLDSLGISHDALTLASGCGHDMNCDVTSVSGADIDYASAHFP